VFRLSPQGEETVLHNFAHDGTDAAYPATPLIMDKSGNLYGTTVAGGSVGFGTVFEISASGSYQILYSFAGGSDGSVPLASLTLDSQGNLYGTTDQGGSNGYPGGGTGFKLTRGSAGSGQGT